MTNEPTFSFWQRSLGWAALLMAQVTLGARGCGTAVVGSECDGSPGQCDAGYFCELPAGVACGTTDRKGTCKPAEEEVACSAQLAPVCGCDGQTYGNACMAERSGATIVDEGACAGAPCGDQLGNACGAGLFCYFAQEAACGFGGQTGTCVAIPADCNSIYIDAVLCGCDGMTYASDCDAQLAGTSIRGPGACPATDGTICGGLTGARCAAGEFCDFTLEAACGTADQTGQCEPIPEVCTDLYAPVCGCDGKDYPNACTANVAKAAVASEGTCAPSTGGVACGGLLGGQCAPGEFCNFALDAFCGTADQTGTCEAIPQACDEILDPVCGCDGVSYGNACDAHFRSVAIASEGACATSTGGGVCGGLIGAQCPGGEFCNFTLDAACGTADQTGTCEAIPEVCDDLFDQVCGCDGNTYPNGCNANAARVSVASRGACP